MKLNTFSLLLTICIYSLILCESFFRSFVNFSTELLAFFGIVFKELFFLKLLTPYLSYNFLKVFFCFLFIYG